MGIAARSADSIAQDEQSARYTCCAVLARDYWLDRRYARRRRLCRAYRIHQERVRFHWTRLNGQGAIDVNNGVVRIRAACNYYSVPAHNRGRAVRYRQGDAGDV